MSRFFIALFLSFTLASCSSSSKDVDGSDPTDQPGDSGESPSQGTDDDDSAGKADDDDSAGKADDDDSAASDGAAATATPDSGGDDDDSSSQQGPDAVAGSAGDASPPPPPPPADFIPPPPGEKGVLERAAILMMGTRFRWVQGSKDVAYGLYGAPVMLNLWSCSDKKIDDNLEWMTLMEKTYSDQMLSILVPANVAERSLTGQDNVCGRSIRFGRSVGIDVGKGVMKELSVDKLPTSLVFNSQGAEVARHEGSMSPGSSAARKLEGALKREMKPMNEGRLLAP